MSPINGAGVGSYRQEKAQYHHRNNPIQQTHHRNPSPSCSTLTHRRKVITPRPVLLLPIMFGPKVIDRSDGRLDLGQVREEVLRGRGFGAGRGFLDKVSLGVA
jgi:hypothetical protein